VFRRRRKGPVSRLAGTQRPECPFSERFRRHFSLRPSVIIEICSALRSSYPAGDGSIAILGSMPPNKRRVRWLSASSQAMAAHESPRTTKLYDRTDDQITLDEVEKIGI
jgi:hypothetical protein